MTFFPLARPSRRNWTSLTANEPAPRRSLATRQNRGSELEVPLGHLPFLDSDSIANVQAIGSLPSIRFEKRLGTVPESDLKKVKAALLKACAL
jgi:mRNA interferase MazF